MNQVVQVDINCFVVNIINKFIVVIAVFYQNNMVLCCYSELHNTTTKYLGSIFDAILVFYISLPIKYLENIIYLLL